jgi:hypothetical protein
MKKLVAISGVLAALTCVGLAAAATPQDKLTGSPPPVGVVTVGPAEDLSGTQPAVPTPPRPAGVFIDRPTAPTLRLATRAWLHTSSLGRVHVNRVRAP